MKYFPWIAIAFVAAALICAFFLIGSPAHQRLVRFDGRRLNDLQNLQYQISNYFAAKGKLPAALADLQGFDGSTIPLDPENGQLYEYTIKGPRNFQLCANFALTSEEGQGNRPFLTPDSPYIKEILPTNWRHPAGRGCFDLTLEESISDSAREFPSSITVKPVD